VEAPLAVSAVLSPAQSVVVPFTEMEGVGFTLTVTLAVSEQPLASVPVTV
jgi:hypothetical protein